MRISDIIQNYQIKKAIKPKKTSERAELIGKFVERLNADRVASGYKPLKASVYAIKMAKYKTLQSLYQFYGYCNEAKNFSATWWWSIKNK